MAHGYRGFWRLNRRKQNAAKSARGRRAAEAKSLTHEGLEGRQMLAFSAQLNGTELVFFNAANDASTVSLFMQDATGSSFYYSIDGGPLTPAPTPFGTGPQTGITAIRVLDSVTDGSGSGGDSLELYGFGSATIDVSGKNILFGGTTPITTLNVENFLIDGLESRSPVNLDGVSVTNDLSIRNASVTTIATTSRLEVGRNLSIDTNTLQLPGAMSVGSAASLVLAGGVLQAANAPITASTLTVVNSVSGDVLLTNSDNAVDFLSVRNLADSGAVAFTDADGLTVGVAGVGIVASNDAVTISSGGRLTLAQNIEAGDGTVYLIAANGIGQASTAGVIARSLTFRNGSAPVNPSLDVTLLGSLNGVDILAGVNYSFDGDISFANSKGLSIGTGSDGISGLTNFAGVISVTAGGQLSIDDEVLANNSGKVVLAARNGVQQSGAGRIVGRDVDVSNTVSGAVSLGLAANDAEYLTITNKTPDGTVVYSDDTGFTVGIGGITTTTNSGAVSLTAKGTIDQVGSIVTRTLTVSNLDTAAGNLSLGLTTNDVQFVNLANANASGTVSYADTSGFEVGDLGIDAAGNAVSLTAGGAVSQSGDVVVSSLAITQTGTGGVAFTRSTNSIPTVSGSIGTGTLAVTTQTDLVVGSAGISASNADVRLTADGSITQAGSIAAQSLHAENTSAAAGDVLLVNPLNDIASFTATNPNADGSVTMATAGSTAVGAAGVNAAGDISLTVAASLNGTGIINLVGAINTTAGDLTITAAQGSLAFSPTDRQITVPGGRLTLRSTSAQILSTPDLLSSDEILLEGEFGVTTTSSLDGLSVTITAACGPVEAANICAVEDVVIRARDTIALTGAIESETGSILVSSSSFDVNLQGVLRTMIGDVNVTAKQNVNVAATVLTEGNLTIAAGLGIVSQGGGIAQVEVLAGGANYEYAIVTVSPPSSGRGRAALAKASIGAGGRITSIEILDPGFGYEPGERVDVQIQGNPGRTVTEERVLPDGTIQIIELQIPPGAGAFAIATASTAVTAITAEGDVTLTAVDDVSLPMVLKGANVSITSFAGATSVTQVHGTGAVTIAGELGLMATGSIDGTTVSLLAACGPVAAADICATADITIGARDDIRLTGVIESENGNVAADSSAGGIFLDANIVAAGEISLDVQTFLQQATGTGIETITIVSAGLPATTFPDITVTVAPPSAGGIPATARALIGQRTLGRDAQSGQTTIQYFLESILITNPGQGYALGEKPAVTIIGGFNGAIAEAVGPTNLRNLTAGDGISITAIDDVTLVNAITTQSGDVSIKTINGRLDLGAATSIITTEDGSIDLISQCSTVLVQAVCASDDVTIQGDGGVSVVRSLDAGGSISLSAGVGNVNVAGELLAETGDISLTSTSGGANLAANLNAGNAIDIGVHGGIAQAAGSGVRRVDLLSGGESLASRVPRVVVSIAPPSGGGVPATAFARLESFSNALGQTRYRISAIDIINPGSGYVIGETPAVQITGDITGAEAIAIGPTGFQNLIARFGITIIAGDDIALRNTIRSTEADIAISSTDGNIAMIGADSLLHAPVGAITAKADAGLVEVVNAQALKSVVLDGEMGATVLTSIVAGAIEVGSGVGNIDLKGMLTAQNGAINIESRSASVTVAANLDAVSDSVAIKAAGGIQQTVASGLREVEVLFGGESEDGTVPTVEVSIARPAAGGIAATAFAKLRGFTNPLGFQRYTIDSIIITNPGRGYAIGERPQVTIAGVVGAAALAYGPIGFQNIVAKEHVTIETGTDVILTNTVRATTGDIVVSSTDGNLIFGDADLLHALQGSVTAISESGFIDVERIKAGGGITIDGQSRVSLEKEFISGTGDIAVTSRSGTILLTANLNATAANLSLNAHQGVLQTAETGITELKILAPGTAVQNAAPNVVVTIAPPAGGGTAATAEALTEIIGRTPDGNTSIWGIQELIITNPGDGYAIGENPLVSFTGISGAVAVAVGPTSNQIITASGNITITSGDATRLVNIVRATEGDVRISSSSGNMDLSSPQFIAQAMNGSVLVAADAGDLTLRHIEAATDATISAAGSVNLLGPVVALQGDVAITSTEGDLDFTADEALIFADIGGVSLTSLNGSIFSPPVLNVGADALIRSFSTVRLTNEVTSVFGSIDVTSTSGGIALGANLVANNDSISLTAKSGVTQLGRGIASIKVLTAGQKYTAATRVTLAAPIAGGVTATARPVIDRTGAITGIQIINPGSGYGVGEEVTVTITGSGTGATAAAYASSVLQNISATKNVSINAGAGIALLNTVSTLDGDISLRANVGDIDLRTETVKLSAKNGSVDISTFTGSILSPPTLHVSKSISLQSSTTLTLANEMTASSGDITLRSTSGAVNLENNLFAGDRITLDANAGILQTKGFVQAAELVVANKSALPVVVGSQENNVDRFAGTSVGGMTYVDADSFETGVLRGNKLGDQRIEVSTNGALTLQAGTSSSGPLRIVGGVSAAPNQLFLSSGSAAIPGQVEYVVTNSQSAGQSTFTGSLANMVRLANLNKARFDDQVVPQTIVFDADGYAVETITVTAAIPLITQPVTIDGSATEATVTNDRVEVRSGSSGVLNGLMFGTGSAGSEVTGLSVTGFSRGAGIALMSSNATVTDTLVGVHRDGTISKASRNLVGIDIGGTSASSNTIGGSSASDANVIGGNGTGVRIRGRASGNVVSGNFVGTDAEEAVLGNSIGVQIVGSSSNLVSENLISNNTDGVQLNTATATAATANRIELNTIVGNSAGAGVRVSASSFALVGGADVGNVIGNNGAGIVITGGSTSNVVAGNYIGTNADGDLLGNKTDGVQVFASIGNTIGGTTEDARNFVANNGGSGIVIRNSVASTAAGGNRVILNTSTNNAKHGILVEGGSFHTIGNGADTGNTITLNDGDGIRVQSFGKTSSSRNLIRGNLVGTDSRIADIDLGNTGDGIAIIGGSANRLDLGNVVRFNAANGVRVEGSSSNFIGSDIVDEGNVIRDNLANGVVITGGATNLLARDNVVAGNLIDRNGTAPGSATSGNGVLVSGNRTVNTAIGTRIVNGRLFGQGNDISDNEGYGVSVVAGASNVQIQGNAIAENNLGPVNIATGANANVATPVITSATLQYLSGTAAQLVVTGTVTGPLTQQLAIDIYCTPKTDVMPGKTAYGRRHVGRFTVTITNDTGAGTLFEATLAIDGATTGDLITATATTMAVATGTTTPDGKPIFVASPIGSTSQLSTAVLMTLPTNRTVTGRPRRV